MRRSRLVLWFVIATMCASACVVLPAPPSARASGAQLTGRSVAVPDATVPRAASVDAASIPSPSDPATITVGPDPDALALDSATGRLYVANDGAGGTGSGSLSVVNLSSDSVEATVPGLPDPEGLALDSLNAQLFVPELTPCCPSEITVINVTNDSVAAEITSGVINPAGAVFDPNNGLVYVSEPDAGAILAIDPSNDSVLTILANGGPSGLAVDPTNGYLYVAEPSWGNITVINGSTNKIDGSITPPPGNLPRNLAYDPVNGYLYSADMSYSGCDSCSGNLSVIDPVNDSVLVTLPVGIYPRGPSVDPSNGRVFVSCGADTGVNSPTGSITVVDGGSNTVIGSIPVGEVPGPSAFDTVTGDLYVADTGSDTVTIVPGNLSSFPVTVSETGLSAGVSWNLNLSNGQAYSSSDASLTFFEPNGTYGATASTSGNAYIAAPFGPIVVNGTAVSVTVSFSANPNRATFVEAGLPAGTFWVVGLTGTARNGSQAYHNSSTSSILFIETTGTYSFVILSAHGFQPDPSSGYITLNGTALEVNVTFSWTYLVSFVEEGLPLGTEWYVNISSEGSESSTTTTVTVSLPNETYTYSVASANKNYSAVGSSFTVNGAAVSKSVLFRPETDPVTFTSTPKAATFLGLPATEGCAMVAGILVVVVAAGVTIGLYRTPRRPAASAPTAPPSSPMEPPKPR